MYTLMQVIFYLIAGISLFAMWKLKASPFGMNVADGTVWNLPNYFGELFTASPTQTPVLSMIGGLNGGQQTNNFEFPVDQTYTHETAAQPAITETASLTVPAAISYVRSQDKNVVGIYHEQVSISYAKLSTMGRLSGISTAGVSANPPDEKAWQIAKALEKIARDVEYTTLNGTYQIQTSAAVAGKSRGLIEAAGTTIAAGGAALSKTLIDKILRDMYAAGAFFKNTVFVANAFQKQKISTIYGYAPTDRNVGGLNIKTVETDFGTFGVVLDPFMPAATLGIFDMSVCYPVTQPIPGKGNLFYEELAKTGASEKGQIYGQIGLNHGPGFAHGTITGLATS